MNSADDTPNKPNNTENAPGSLAEALSIRRNAGVGVAVGIGLAALLYVPRLPVLDVTETGSGGYYLGLALVLAATTAAAVTAGLSAKVMLEPVLDRPAWLRRGGTAGAAGGLCWAGLPAFAWIASEGVVPTGLWRAVTAAAALLLVVGTAGLHAAIRGGTGPSRAELAAGGTVGPRARTAERITYWVVVLALLLAAGNASGDAGPVVETTAGPLATPFLTAAFLALAAAVPFAAAAELSGGIEARSLRALQVGALLGTLGVAWLVAAGGWTWLDGVAVLGGDAGAAGPVAAGLAVATVPSGLGWAVAGLALRAAAVRQDGRRETAG